MQLRWKELEPELLRRIKDDPRALALIATARPQSAPAREAPRMTVWRGVQTVLLTFWIWFLGICAGAALSQITETGGVILFLLLLAAAPVVAGFWAKNGWRLPSRPQEAAITQTPIEEAAPVSRKTLQKVFEVLQPRGIDALYARAVLLLMDLVAEKRMTEAQAREVLSQTNGLMLSDQELEAKLQSIVGVVGLEDLPQMQEERDTLARRLEKATDRTVHQATQRSLQMLETRIQNAQEMLLVNERIHAQRDAIEQTMGSLESSLARMRVAPDVNDEKELHHLQATVSDLNRETRSVERAVDEVVRLTSGSSA